MRRRPPTSPLFPYPPLSRPPPPRPVHLARPAARRDLSASARACASAHPKRRGALGPAGQSRDLSQPVLIARQPLRVGSEDTPPPPARTAARLRAPRERASGGSPFSSTPGSRGLALLGAQAC